MLAEPELLQTANNLQVLIDPPFVNTIRLHLTDAVPPGPDARVAASGGPRQESTGSETLNWLAPAFGDSNGVHPAQVRTNRAEAKAADDDLETLVLRPERRNAWLAGL